MLAVIILLSQPAPSPGGLGLLVESVEKGMPAYVAGLRPGDVLVSWRPVAEGEGIAAPAGGPLASPFDLAYLEGAVAPRLPIELAIRRAGQPVDVRVAGGEWRVRSRPVLDPRDGEAYAVGEALVRGGDTAAGAAVWLELVEAAGERGDWTRACWLSLRIVESAPPESRSLSPDPFALATDTCASTRDPAMRAAAQEALAGAWQSRQEYAEAEAGWREALRQRGAEGPPGLALARAHQGLALLLMERGRPHEAQTDFRRALELRQTLAPESLEVAASLNQLALIEAQNGQLECASELFTRALEIGRRLAPESLLTAASLANLGSMVKLQGRFVEGRDLALQALAMASAIEPGGFLVADIELELGRNAWHRGDVAAAESHYRKALAIAERIAPERMLAQRCLSNLGTIAQARGDWESAEVLYRRALALCRRHWPEALFTAGVLANLGINLAEQGRLAEAAALYDEAVALGEKVGPRSGTLAFILITAADLSQARGDHAAFEAQVESILRLAGHPTEPAPQMDQALGLKGEVALGRGELAEAEDWFDKAITSAERYTPGDDRLAIARHRLARLHRLQRRTSEAAESYRRTVEAIEAQRGRLGGRGQGRLGFGVRHAQVYQEAVEVLLEAGHVRKRPSTTGSFRAPVASWRWWRSATW